MPSFRPNVALLLLDEEDRLLVCERYKVPGAWQFPQGGVATGESPEEALQREVREEIGLPVGSYRVEESRGGYRYVYPKGVKKMKKGGFDGQEQTYFRCRLMDGAPPIDVVQRPQEFQQHKWIRPGEFSMAWLPEFKREIYRAVMRDFFGVEI